MFNLSPKTIIKNIKLKDILSHPSNKRTLCDLFAEKCIAMLRIEKKNFVVAHGTNIVSKQWIQITADNAQPSRGRYSINVHYLGTSADP